MPRPIRMLLMALAMLLMGVWAGFVGGWFDPPRYEIASAACAPGSRDDEAPSKAPRAGLDQTELEEEDDEYRTDGHAGVPATHGAAPPSLFGCPALAWSARTIERGPPEPRLEPATPPPRS